MSDHDLLLQTIGAIYASGTESDRLPKALEGTAHLLGAAGAIFEVADKPTHRRTEFYTAGTPNVARDSYIEHFASINPRFSFALHLSPGQVTWDRQVMDETAIARDPFYAEFLPNFGLRYFVATVVQQTTKKFAAVSVQRTQKQGHVEQREIDLLGHLCPHFQRAYDVASRLKAAVIRHGALENTFDWLTDGVALLRADGRTVYTNEALCTFARRRDGFHLIEGSINFISPEASHRFCAAFDAVKRACKDVLLDGRPTDFPVPRGDGMPAYTVAVRPLVRGQAHALEHADAVAMLLVHDPLARNVAANQTLQELFGLTRAEANLAQALCAGMTTSAYASTRRLSLNTIYTHLRRLREKTNCKSVAELTRKFGELNVPLRLS